MKGKGFIAVRRCYRSEKILNGQIFAFFCFCFCCRDDPNWMVNSCPKISTKQLRMFAVGFDLLCHVRSPFIPQVHISTPSFSTLAFKL
ncbi:unnamed protein product [Chondrus crispus]|uniref:Uncharacterized protein n=1 Tax=Chondrus crispus TaxID=2769 RepID=R7QD45_CHOCR|nr:unnamed protein product [Chondrus crispus]CDF35375.1 unnamed protein product [Chondrus crispus]|eukprot:XP_005715194.1 unnamed protein product [Chondrus crispus]